MMNHNQALFQNYNNLIKYYDEFFSSDGQIIPSAKPLLEYFNQLGVENYQKLHNETIKIFDNQGVTFGARDQQNKAIFPFDLIPRLISAKEWNYLERGVLQRVLALNIFLKDIYHEQKIIKDLVIPRELVYSSPGYCPNVQNIRPIGGVYIHIAGIDIIRDQFGNYLVLEDNLRIPSGVSYALTNRQVMKAVAPEIFSGMRVISPDNYPQKLAEALNTLIKVRENEVCVVLTPGPYNAAYYEHSYLANNMNWTLAQGQDLFVKDRKVYLKTKTGEKLVRIIYRRVEDSYLDPNFFRAESLLGVPGIMEAYQAGNVLLANAIGNGVADDKAMFHYVPKIIKYYLGEEPILPQVETYLCCEPKYQQYVLKNLEKLVIKKVDQSGGVDLLIGQQATRDQIESYHEQILRNPRAYIAQPLVELSTCPTWNGSNIVPKRIDLRPYVVSGKNNWVFPGGLTRVALKENSYIVNSCQGGGSKDTWVLDRDRE